jgi:nicotinamidase/pyrazinamidase
MKALVLVDMQNDFMPGGALAIKRGDMILPIINRLLSYPFDFIIATMDIHPPKHGSFAATHGKEPGEVIFLDGLKQILWPIHCVRGTYGAELCAGWDHSKINMIIEKGVDINVDSYSAFFDNAHRRNTGLGPYLNEHRIDEVYIAGLATDYCVKHSVLDARILGFKTYIIEDACCGVNLLPSDSLQAIEEMKCAGATIIMSTDLLKQNHQH